MVYTSIKLPVTVLSTIIPEQANLKAATQELSLLIIRLAFAIKS